MDYGMQSRADPRSAFSEQSAQSIPGTTESGDGSIKTSPLENGIEHQGAVISRLHRSLSLLQGRLLTVMAPTSPSTELNKPTQEKTSRLIQIIEQHSTMIEAAIDRVHKMMERLEL